MNDAFSIHDLEADLGLGARLTVIANAGGQQKYVPKIGSAKCSVLAREFGLEITFWLAARYGGTMITIPSRRGMEQEGHAAMLRAAVLDAGLTEPKRSASFLAKEFNVTERYIRFIRASLRDEQTLKPLPLFDQPFP